jgi:DNA repair protein RadA/Sms
MARPRSIHTCEECGHQAPKWLGRCPECRTWNSLVEEVAPPMGASVGAALGVGQGNRPVPLMLVQSEGRTRSLTGIGELDRVLGGGVVAGQVTLLGGDPGIGKSTLLLAALNGLAAAGPVLYVSGEESARQIKLRAERLGAVATGLHLLCETDADRVLQAAEALKPKALAIDSIQTLHLGDLASAPGSVTQVREVTGRLLAYAKNAEVPTFLAGHVTKDGAIAGPRVLEHLVDTVLYFEGDRGLAYRVLRAHRTAMARATRSASSRCASPVWRKCPIPLLSFWLSAPPGFPALLSLRPSQGAVPYCTRSRRWSPPRPTGLPGAPRSASTGIASL